MEVSRRRFLVYSGSAAILALATEPNERAHAENAPSTLLNKTAVDAPAAFIYADATGIPTEYDIDARWAAIREAVRPFAWLKLTIPREKNVSGQVGRRSDACPASSHWRQGVS